MDSNFSACRACGAEIRWIKTRDGKSMPCNQEGVFFTPGGGPHTFVTPQGMVVRGTKGVSWRSHDGRFGYTPHWATCPQADRFRKKKES